MSKMAELYAAMKTADAIKESGPNREFAKVVWTVDDVLTLRPKWTRQRAEGWLEDNQGHISDRLIELGWEIMGDLVRYEDTSEPAL